MIRWAAGRPAVIWSLAAGIIIAGGVAFTRLPLATKTQVDTPRISVSALWNGASPELVETYITSPVEAAIQGVRGVRKISSTSSEGNSSITVELDPGIDMTFARLAILEQMEVLRQDLPREARQSLRVSQYVPEDLAEAPLLEINVTGSYTPGTLTRITEDLVVPRFAALQGIAGTSVRGVAQNGVVISYDAAHLRLLGIDPSQLSTALQSARMIDVIGAERLGATERSVVLRDVPNAVEDLGRLPITDGGGKVHRLDEIAEIRPEEDSRGRFYRLNGLTAVTLTLTREGGADAIKTVARAKEALVEAQRGLPPGVQLRIASDASEDLVDQLNDLMLRGAIAFSAVAIMLLLTLRSFRSAALVLGSAAVAIAGTALGLYLLEIPANMLTLAGLAMGIGILVQNGLIVVDRLRRSEDTPDARADAGVKITPAVMGATLTTAVVLLPFLFLQGNARAAFTPFAAAFALALFCSVATALVLIPAVGRGGNLREAWGRLSRGYDWTVRHTLRWRYLTVFFTVASLGVLTWGFIKKVPRSSWGNWWGERREVVRATVSFPRGSDPEQVEHLVAELEQVAVGRPGVALVRAEGSPRGGQLVVEFTPEGGRTESPWVIYEELTQRAVLVGGTEGISVQPPEGQGYYNGSGGGSGGSRRIKILGYSFEGVRQVALDLQRRLEQINRVRDVDINAASFWGRQGQSSISLKPDREKLGQVGASSRDFATSVAREIRSGEGGASIEFGDDELPVAVRALGVRERQFDQLREAYVSNPQRAPIQIDDVAEVGEVQGLAEIQREDQQYLRVVSYDFRGPPKLAERTHKAFMESISVPRGYTVDDSYFGWEPDDSGKGLYLVFGIGVVLVLLSVALVFDSWWATVMVFFSLLMALGGVAAAFWITETAFTREAAVGVILVVGQAINQAILLIDGVLIAKRRHGGPATVADVVHAARDRAGMIVLVTLTTIASLVPMAWGTASDTMFGAIALAVAGGTVAGTIAALWLMPAVLVGRWRWRRRRTAVKSAT
ncbi:MAG TPA: efflux RND transporter permease subunit [Gemmatimonadales bacterium]|nr:efflux RND transporter permease subunit [Gemmatimonadales bacterium]